MGMMDDKNLFGKIDVNLVSSMDELTSSRSSDIPFRIIVLGDFSGRSNRGIKAGVGSKAERTILVDRDNFDNVMASLNIRLDLDVTDETGKRIHLEFKELDDFHPDRLFQQVPLFDKLRDIRTRLHNPSTYAQAKAELESWIKPEVNNIPIEEPQTVVIRDTSTNSTDGLLDQILGTPTASVQKTESIKDRSWNNFLKELVDPYLVSDQGQLSTIATSVDDAISGLMRELLHHPEFQLIESAWRALYFLVTKLETGSALKIYILDISKEELSNDLLGTEELSTTNTYKLLVEQTIGTPGADPWSLLIGDYSFKNTHQDIEILGRIAKLAHLANAPFIAQADPQLLGCSSIDQLSEPNRWTPTTKEEDSDLWNILRRVPESSHIGLALPGFLLRLPYGKDTDPIEEFEFEEIREKLLHEALLWGNPAFACAYLLALAFTEDGWSLRPGTYQEIEDLPLYVYKEDEESRVKPCAEVLLTQRSAEAIMDNGLMALLSFKDQDKIRLTRFQSIAEPPTSLAGRWD
jgi:type VI secretion system protein ImpC